MRILTLFVFRDVLKHKELKEHIESDCLGPLLSEAYIRPLEEQYLTHKEVNVSLKAIPEITLKQTHVAFGSGITPHSPSGNDWIPF